MNEQERQESAGGGDHRLAPPHARRADTRTSSLGRFDPAGREAAFEESLVLRVLEAALDQDGYSTTVRAVAAAIARR